MNDLGQATATPPTQPVIPPPAAPGATNGMLGDISVDWRRMVRGNWLGAGIIAVSTAFTAGLLGLLLALLAKPADFGLENTLTLATMLATGAFGADAQGEVSTSEVLELSGHGSLGTFPFTITLAALAVAVFLFRRITRGYPSGLLALADGARAALIFGICLWLPALIFTSSNEEMGRGWAMDLAADELGLEAELSASAGGALALGFLILFTVLALSVLCRRDWWTGRMLHLRDWIAAPIAGWATFSLLLPLAGVIGFLAMAFTGESTDVEVSGDETRLIGALVIAFLANGGFALLGLGAGTKVGSSADGTDMSSQEEWSRLWGSISDDEPGLWVSPFVLVAVLAMTAFIVMRKAGRARALPALGVWLASFLLVVPLLVRLTSLHVAGSVTGEDEHFEGSMFVGPEGLQTTFLMLLAGIVVAFAVALLTGVLHPATVRDRIARMARSVQSVPGQGAPPSAQSNQQQLTHEQQ